MNHITTQLSQIGYIQLQITMQPLSGTPEQGRWYGSALRGAIGNAMLRRFCPEQQFHCENCTHPCSTGILFSSAKPDHSEEAVNPYVIDCPDEPFSDGQLRFGLTFFARGLEAAEHVMLALHDGIVLGNKNVPFRLTGVVDRVTQESLFDGAFLRKPQVHYPSFSDAPAERYCIEFLTPYRTKLPAKDFGFPQLTRAMLRRISTVMRQAGMEPEFDYAGLIAKSEQIRTQHRMLTPVSRTRYSSRTDTRWDVTGFTGAMIVSGDFSEFLPLLRMTEIVGAGKLCVMGLGRIKVSSLK